jgi:hypothetical protein
LRPQSGNSTGISNLEEANVLKGKRARPRQARLAYSIKRLARDTDLKRTLIYDEIKAGRLIKSKLGGPHCDPAIRSSSMAEGSTSEERF